MSITKTTSLGTLTGTITLKGAMNDHLLTTSFFIQRALSHVNAKTTEIHPPPYLKRYWVIKSPFIFAKTKEIFEKKVHKNIIQIHGVPKKSISNVVDYVLPFIPPGVDLNVDYYEYFDSVEHMKGVLSTRIIKKPQVTFDYPCTQKVHNRVEEILKMLKN